MLVVINPEQRIPPGHPLRRINLGSQVAAFVELGAATIVASTIVPALSTSLGLLVTRKAVYFDQRRVRAHFEQHLQRL